MSIFDDIRSKANDLIGGNKDAANDGIDKAGDFIDSKTGGKFKDQVDGTQSSGNDYVNGLGGLDQAGAPVEGEFTENPGA